VLEPLERRDLLSVTASFAAGVLTFTGDGAADALPISSTANVTDNTIDYDIGGGPVSQAAVTDVVFDGGLGSDVLSISAASTAVNLSISTVSSNFELLTNLVGTVANPTPLTSLTVDGTAAINGGGVTTSGSQTYNGAVTLAANTILTTTAAGGGVTFNSTITGATFNLTVSAQGTTTFNDPVSGVGTLLSDNGGTTVVNDPISAAQVQIDDAVTLNVASPSVAVTTSGSQTYNGAVTLGANTILTTTAAGGGVTFNSTITGATFNLTVSAQGTTTFNDPVSGVGTLLSDNGGTTVVNDPISAAQVQIDDAVTLNVASPSVAVTTSGSQTYNGAVTLGADTTLKSTGAGNLVFDQTVKSDLPINFWTLIVNTAGLTWFNGDVGVVNPLGGLTTDVFGTTRLGNGTAIQVITKDNPTVLHPNWLGNQAFYDPVQLGGNTLVKAGGTVTFVQTVDSNGIARTLEVDAAGTTTFGGAVGNQAGGPKLASLLVKPSVGAAATTIGGGIVKTDGNQTYSNPVTVAANGQVTIPYTFTAITTDSDPGDGKLRVNSPSVVGVTAIRADLVGLDGIDRSAALNTIDDSPSAVKGHIKLSNAADFNKWTLFSVTGLATPSGYVNIASAFAGFSGQPSLWSDTDPIFFEFTPISDETVLTAGGNVDFVKTVDSDDMARKLKVDATGLTTFGGPVGSALPLLSLEIMGSAAINGGNVTTSGNSQTYHGPVTLGADTTLTATGGGNIVFDQTVNSDLATNFWTLTVITTGLTWFQGNVGTINPLGGLSTDAPGMTHLGNGTTIQVTTKESQTGLHPTWTGNQSYGDGVLLKSDTTITTLLSAAPPVIGVANVTFGSAINSDLPTNFWSLSVNCPRLTEFKANVGTVNPLGALTTDVLGTTQLGSGPAMLVVTREDQTPSHPTWTGNQTYGDAVVLKADTTIIALLSAAPPAGGVADVTFAATVNSDLATTFWTLEVVCPRVTWFQSNVGTTLPLGGLSTDAGGTTQFGNGATIELRTNENQTGLHLNWNGNQIFGDAVLLKADMTITTVLSGVPPASGVANVTFNSTVNNDLVANFWTLLVNCPRTTWFKSNVGTNNPLGGLTTDASGTTQLGNGTAIEVVTKKNQTLPHPNWLGDQTYGDPVLLKADTSITAHLANVTFESTVNNDAATNFWTLTVTCPGTTWFKGNVGTTNPLGGLSTDAGGTTQLGNGTTIEVVTKENQTGPHPNWLGNQSYGDPVLLKADSTITTFLSTVPPASGVAGVTFESTVNSDLATNFWTLTVNCPRSTWFKDNVGTVIPLGRLTTDAPGTTQLGGSLALMQVITKNNQSGLHPTWTGSQDYGDAVVLMVDSSITAGTAAVPQLITFHSTVDALVDGAQGLTNNGNVLFLGSVGWVNRLKDLTDNWGNTTFNIDPAIAGQAPPENGVNTKTFQTYNGPVILEKDTTLVSGFVGQTPAEQLVNRVTFLSTVDALVDGAQFLRIDGNVLFDGSVGWNQRLKSLTVNGANGLPSLTGVNGGTTQFNVDPAVAGQTAPENGANTKTFQTYNGPVVLDKETFLKAGTPIPAPDPSGKITFNSTISSVAPPRGLTIEATDVTTFNGVVGTATLPLDFLKVTTGGPLEIKVNVTTKNNILLKVTKGVNSPINDTLTVGSSLSPVAVNKVLSTEGDIEFDVDSDNSPTNEDLLLLANSVVEATLGSVTLKGDFSNNSVAGTQIMLKGTINAPKDGENVTVRGNTHNDTITLADEANTKINTKATNIEGVGGKDTINVRKTLELTTTNLTTMTNIIGGNIATASGNNITVNLGSSNNTIDTIKGLVKITGSPFAQLPSDARVLVNYAPNAVPAGNPPPGIVPLPLPTAVSIPSGVGNIVNVFDSNRAVPTNNVYTLSGIEFKRTGAATIMLANDAASAIQTFALSAGKQGNNKIAITLPEISTAKPLLHVNVDGGQTSMSPNVNLNVLSVKGATSSNVKVNTTIGGLATPFNTIIAGDATTDVTGGAVQPIKFTHIKSLYLTGTTGRDFMVNNTNSIGLPADRVFGVMDGLGGGDWMMTGKGVNAQDVLFGGGVISGTSVFMFGRATSPPTNSNPNTTPSNAISNGFFLPNNSLTGNDASTISGSSFIDGINGLYSAAATNGNVNNVRGSVFLGAGSLNVVSWLKANFQRKQGSVLASARTMINSFPKP
jgi:hypothetical protein